MHFTKDASACLRLSSTFYTTAMAPVDHTPAIKRQARMIGWSETVASQPTQTMIGRLHEVHCHGTAILICHHLMLVGNLSALEFA